MLVSCVVLASLLAALDLSPIARQSGIRKAGDHGDPPPLYAEKNVSAEGRYRRFEGTFSPNGAYILAYGRRGAWSPAFRDISKKPEEHFPESALDDIRNYLVDTVHGTVLATLPDFNYYEGPEGVQSRHHLETGWSLDSRGAVALHKARWANGWSCEAASYIDLQQRKCYAILRQMNAEFDRVLPADRKQRDSELIAYSGPVMLDARTLVVEGWVSQSPTEVEYDYRLQFHIEVRGGQSIVTLTKSRPMPKDDIDPGDPDESYADEETEALLEKYYAKVRTTLSRKDRTLLKEGQSRWLACRRRSFPSNASGFANARIHELYVRALKW